MDEATAPNKQTQADMEIVGGFFGKKNCCLHLTNFDESVKFNELY